MGYLRKGTCRRSYRCRPSRGSLQAWANLYDRFAIAMEARNENDGERGSLRFPGIAAGVEGVRWVENCVRSADLGGVWVDYR